MVQTLESPALPTRVDSTIHSPEIRKSFKEAQRKGKTKQNKAILVLFKCVQWLCMASITLVKFKLLLALLHDLGLDDIAHQSKTWS